MNDSSQNTLVFVCPALDQCRFTETLHKKMPELADRIYKNYCTNESAICARFKLFCEFGVRAVPPLMLPNQTDWARQISQEMKYSGNNTTVTESVEVP